MYGTLGVICLLGLAHAQGPFRRRGSAPSPGPPPGPDPLVGGPPVDLSPADQALLGQLAAMVGPADQGTGFAVGQGMFPTDMGMLGPDPMAAAGPDPMAAIDPMGMAGQGPPMDPMPFATSPPVTTTTVDAYTALVPVTIKCTNDPVQGLQCAADFPSSCPGGAGWTGGAGGAGWTGGAGGAGGAAGGGATEEWNFPNPCTPQNLDLNITKFIHPFDPTKFLMCGEMGKLYVVKCPKLEVFHEGCGQCVGKDAGLTASCEIPIDPLTIRTIGNPCTPTNIINNKLFFRFPGDVSKFIHCDIWGKPWERHCTANEVWSQVDVSCVDSLLYNPCSRASADLALLYRHPCDAGKYLQCDDQRNAYMISCPVGEAFSEPDKRCLPIGSFPGSHEGNICGKFVFGFRLYVSASAPPAGVLNSALLAGQFTALNTADASAIIGGGMQGAAGGMGGADPVAAFMEAFRQSAQGQTGALANSQLLTQNGKGISIPGVHDSQLREYDYSTQPYTAPCTRNNLAEGRYHFRYRGFPHKFLQCDHSGRMYVMPCSNNQKDWFDPITNTCVDGSVFVDNRVQKTGK